MSLLVKGRLFMGMMLFVVFTLACYVLSAATFDVATWQDLPLLAGQGRISAMTLAGTGCACWCSKRRSTD